MKSILLVEDTLHLAEEIADILRLEGHLVTIANNALQALELLAVSIPNLIITDITMPGMDGFDLIQKIRSTASIKLIPIIILSAKTSPADKIRGKEVGADVFIQKPCKAIELITSVNSFV